MIRLAICLGLATSLLPGAADDEIRAADQKWAAALKSRDTAVLDRMYTPGLIYAHASGVVEDKPKYLERLKSGKQRYDTVQIESTKIVPYGDSAVSHSIVRTIGVNDKGPFNDHVMMMHVWVKQGGEWRLAAHQTTKIP
jgi:ketosteroid isomerase-like protein